MKLLSNWWRRFEFFYFWEGRPKHRDWDEGEDTTKPLIHFSLDAWQFDTYPAFYHDYNDTNRWKTLQIHMYLSRFLVSIVIPFWKLPDHVPTEKQARARALHDTPEHRERMKKLNEILSDMNDASKKV